MVSATGVGVARSSASTHNMKYERERAAADAEVDAGDPLRSAEAAQNFDEAGHYADQDQRRRTGSDADGEES
jgi:hypothetical protein